MNRRNFLKLAGAVLAAKCMPVRALSAIAPEVVIPVEFTRLEDLDSDRDDRYDYLDMKNWGKVTTTGIAPEWYGMPYWMARPEYISDAYAGIKRVTLP